MKITKQYNAFNFLFDLTFEGSEVLENRDNIFQYLVTEIYRCISLEVEVYDIIEMVGINTQEEYVEEYLAGMDFHGGDDLDQSVMYNFIYTIQTVITELYDIILVNYNKTFTINGNLGAKAIWTEDHRIEIIEEDKEFYIMLINSEIVVFTTLHDLYGADRTSFRFFDIGNLYCIFENLWTYSNPDYKKYLFYCLVENYFYLAEKGFMYKDENEHLSLVEIMKEDHDCFNNKEDIIKEMFYLFKKEIVGKVFYGWLKGSFKIRFKGK